jgi:glycosyltransferase involved in cell wall biosynthesis
MYEKLDQMQLRFLYQSSDILCVPSITTDKEGAEGIPVVLMEGMACGLPVVATRCGAIDELVKEILVDERSSVQLADAIRRLVSDGNLRKQQGSRNREIVRRQYSMNNVVQFGKWLDEIVSDQQGTNL